MTSPLHPKVGAIAVSPSLEEKNQVFIARVATTLTTTDSTASTTKWKTVRNRYAPGLNRVFFFFYIYKERGFHIFMQKPQIF